MNTAECLELLRSELKPAVGCTEPAAIALAVARTMGYLKDDLVELLVEMSGNIYKNAFAVMIPGAGEAGVPLAAALGAVAMAVVSVPVNYYISYPVYAKMFGGLDQIIAAYQVLRPGTDGLMEALLVFNMPFTLLKGTIDAALTFLIYKPLSPVLHGRR